jgi:hypothetical protein
MKENTELWLAFLIVASWVCIYIMGYINGYWHGHKDNNTREERENGKGQ